MPGQENMEVKRQDAGPGKGQVTQSLVHLAGFWNLVLKSWRALRGL